MRARRASSLLVFAIFLTQPALAAASAATGQGAAGPDASLNHPSFADAWWDEYHGTDDVYDFIKQIAADHSDIVALQTIGTTYENRPLLVAKVSDNPHTNEADEPKYFLMAATHAREWTTYHVAAYFLNWLTGNYRETDSGTPAMAAPGEMDNASYASWLVDNREIYILLMVNPDGIEYSHTTDNMWRKNREPNLGLSGEVCYGVDINRNFGYHWGEVQGDSHNPCSETYSGPTDVRTQGLSALRGWRPGDPNPGGFSTRESTAIRDFELSVPFSTALSLHSFSELVLYPWGYTSSPSPDDVYYTQMADKMAAWTGYTPEQGYDLYKTSGVWDDWSYAEAGAFSFTIEMGTAFQPPASEIINQSKLLLSSLAYLGETADDLHLDAPSVKVDAAPRLEVDAGAPTQVTAHVDAPNGLDTGTVSLVYSRNGGATWSSAKMRAVGDDGMTYVGDLPGLAGGSQAVYYVKAVDDAGITRTGPFSAPYSVYFVTARPGLLDAVASYSVLLVLGAAAAVGVLLYLRSHGGIRMPALPRGALRRPSLPRRVRPRRARPAPRAEAAPERPARTAVPDPPRPVRTAVPDPPRPVRGPPYGEVDFDTYKQSRPRLQRFLDEGEL